MPPEVKEYYTPDARRVRCSPDHSSTLLQALVKPHRKLYYTRVDITASLFISLPIPISLFRQLPCPPSAWHGALPAMATVLLLSSEFLIPGSCARHVFVI